MQRFMSTFWSVTVLAAFLAGLLVYQLVHVFADRLVRMGLTRGAGRWAESSGTNSKFGLNVSELMTMVNELEAAESASSALWGQVWSCSFPPPLSAI